MPADVQSPLTVYLDHLERGELAYQFSIAAGRPVFFPRVLCPFTGSDRLEWRVSAGIGTVHATTVVHPAEGAPDKVRIGLRVRFRVHRPGGDEPPYPVFVPVEAA